MNQCDFCKKTFSTTYNLKIHQTTNKSCIAIQKDTGIEVVNNRLTCEYCNKELSTKSKLNYHLTICKTQFKIVEPKQEVNQTFTDGEIIKLLKILLKNSKE